MRKAILCSASAILLAVLAASHTGCAVSTPFAGPGYRASTGLIPKLGGETVVVALTSAVLDGERRAAFDRATTEVADAMGTVEGLVGFSFRKELLGDRVWTLSAWEDEAALTNFVRSGLHRAAVRAGRPAAGEFRFYSFRVPADQIPLAWQRALELLVENGTGYADRFGG